MYVPNNENRYRIRLLTNGGQAFGKSEFCFIQRNEFEPISAANHILLLVTERISTANHILSLVTERISTANHILLLVTEDSVTIGERKKTRKATKEESQTKHLGQNN